MLYTQGLPLLLVQRYRPAQISVFVITILPYVVHTSPFLTPISQLHLTYLTFVHTLTARMVGHSSLFRWVTMPRDTVRPKLLSYTSGELSDTDTKIYIGYCADTFNHITPQTTIPNYPEVLKITTGRRQAAVNNRTPQTFRASLNVTVRPHVLRDTRVRVSYGIDSRGFVH